MAGRLCVLIAAVAVVLATGTVGALAHGGNGDADAGAPFHDDDTDRMVGTGNYRTPERHAVIQVQICLQKRQPNGSWRVISDNDCSVRSRTDASVISAAESKQCPVGGTWRTRTIGKAINNNGAVVHRAEARSGGRSPC
jgi:hypothetical protein